jgi:uncharacterized protein (DUF2141 family)
MHPHHNPTIIILFLALILSASNLVNQEPSLQIQILNIEKGKGKIVIEIYKDKSDWLKTPFRKATLSTDESTKTALFNIPAGKYAVSIYQDTNENGKLDQNFLGIPREPVGFGNNYRPFGKPSFESALIEQNATSKPEAIKLFSVL